MSTQKIIRVAIFITLFFTVISLIMDFFHSSSQNTSNDVMVANRIMFRMMSGMLMSLVLYKTLKINLFKVHSTNHLLFVIFPAVLISLNNFPLSAYFGGRTTLDEPYYRVFLFFIECFSVGFFEEIIFRGVLLALLISKWSSRKYGVQWSILTTSLLFGAAHLFNFAHLGIQHMLMQIGYSFLLGIMWAGVFLKTRNIWIVIWIHALYNFFGLVLFEMGTVNQRFDTLTILITLTLSLLAAIHTLFIFISFNKNNLDQNLTVT